MIQFNTHHDSPINKDTGPQRQPWRLGPAKVQTSLEDFIYYCSLTPSTIKKQYDEAKKMSKDTILSYFNMLNSI